MMRIAFAVFACVLLAYAGTAFADCPTGPAVTGHHTKKHVPSTGCVNLSGVPEITAGVVAAEPAPLVNRQGYSPPTQNGYEGPTLGLTKPDPGVRPVPTVGYHWRLE